MEIRPFADTDEHAVIALWNEVLPDSAPHNDPATAIRQKLAVERDLFLVAQVEGLRDDSTRRRLRRRLPGQRHVVVT